MFCLSGFMHSKMNLTSFIQEIDEQRYEVRKIEIYKNGTIARYDEQMTDSLFRLADVKFPENLDEINQYQEFCAKYISQEEFETMWNKI